MQHSAKKNSQPRWQSKIELTARDQRFELVFCTKKEKSLWLTELSRAVEWADGASPVKA